MNRGQFKSPNILVIEPDSDIRCKAEKILANDGFRVESVSSTESAQKMLGDINPDIIIYPFKSNSPDISHTEYIKSKCPDSKIIAMIDNDDISAVREAIIAGADDFIFRPFSSDDLMFIIERMMGLSVFVD